MNLHRLNFFAGAFFLLAYTSMGVFGLLKFNHTNEMPMPSCPYAQNVYSLCENNLGHIDNWRQFSNTIFPSLFILSMLLIGIVLYFFSKQKFLNQKQYFHKWKYYLYNKKLYSYQETIIKWLSLFENSPSLIFKA